MQESYIVYSVQSTEHDFDEMWNKQEAFAEAELGNLLYALKGELEDE